MYSVKFDPNYPAPLGYVFALRLFCGDTELRWPNGNPLIMGQYLCHDMEGFKREAMKIVSALMEAIGTLPRTGKTQDIPMIERIHLYQSLADILSEALRQAAVGKGKDRHASDGEAFEDQPICEIARRLGGGDLFQAVKKIYESVRLPGEAGVHELLGAINYIVAEIILRREKRRDS